MKKKFIKWYVYQVKENKYIYTAPIESIFFFVSLCLFRSVFRSNSAISSIFLNSAHMRKQLDYRVAALKPQVANAYWGNQCSIVWKIASNFQIW